MADDLEAVLNLGNVASRDIDMSGNNISRCSNLDVSTINGASYPPTVTLDQVLTADNIASRNIDMSGNQILSSTGNITINVSDSSGTGTLTLIPKLLGNLILQNLPTSSVGLPSGAIWVDTTQDNTLKIV